MLLISVFLSWLSIDNSYISSQNPIVYNYNIVLKIGAVWLAFYLYLLLQNLGDMQSKTSPATFTNYFHKVRELIVVKVLHTSLLNTTVVTFKVLPLESYAPMPQPSPPFKTILEMVL